MLTIFFFFGGDFWHLASKWKSLKWSSVLQNKKKKKIYKDYEHRRRGTKQNFIPTPANCSEILKIKKKKKLTLSDIILNIDLCE